MMKKALIWFGLFLFAAIQIADVAILDAAAYEAHGTHVAADKDQSGPAADSCVMHCGCHATHHMNAAASAAGIAAVTKQGPMPTLQSILHMAEGQGPPVPPPNA